MMRNWSRKHTESSNFNRKYTRVLLNVGDVLHVGYLVVHGNLIYDLDETVEMKRSQVDTRMLMNHVTFANLLISMDSNCSADSLADCLVVFW